MTYDLWLWSNPETIAIQRDTKFACQVTNGSEHHRQDAIRLHLQKLGIFQDRFEIKA